ncbi:uncharacterized protein METZ01_LOCUS382092, partial [marine metagenome]
VAATCHAYKGVLKVRRLIVGISGASGA